MPNKEIAVEVSVLTDSTTVRVPTPWSPGERQDTQYNMLGERQGIRYNMMLAGARLSTAVYSGMAIAAGGGIAFVHEPLPRYALQAEVESLYERIAALEALAIAEPEPLRNISREEAREEIRELFSGGEIIYMSDVAERLNLPDELVVEICLELATEGELNRRDDTVLGR